MTGQGELFWVLTMPTAGAHVWRPLRKKVPLSGDLILKLLSAYIALTQWPLSGGGTRVVL